ncbi:hypothetical protein DGo_PE0006 (plasmid) [Deinococcus gobiensis I-0]|uniref:Uncharacterized protein n=1 Tax=Deinococcus gobiensis (strain DSM 21396 / JCM 16679 / CGMCC 1.7299 / I-0) TaxID=745776 RepID=H8H3Q3_DEIGI|nr:hypothetical protein DGo_PE0006 [Deinococcus gobiensis I-0]
MQGKTGGPSLGQGDGSGRDLRLQSRLDPGVIGVLQSGDQGA